MAVLFSACTAEDYARRADRRVQSVLTERMDSVLGRREATALHPDELPTPAETTPATEAEDQDPAPAEQDAPPEARILGLSDALSIAIVSNRDYLSRKEALYLDALSFTQTYHDFTPQLSSTLGYFFTNPNGSFDSQSADLDLDITQILPFGGSAALNLSTGGLDDRGLVPIYDSAVSISLVQPLLRGFGHDITYEPLVQAERNLIYAVRAFELFREDFTIDVARRFYNLIQQQQTIDNQRRNLESFEFAYRQAEALFKVGRSKELDKLRARRNELNARDDLISAEEDYQLSLDRFRIFLGLPPQDRIDVGGAPPDVVPTSYELSSAIDVALENRLDLITRREQLGDIERALRISRNGLLPDLDLSFNTGAFLTSGDEIFGHRAQADGYDFRVTLDIPLDRVDERANYRRAQIALERERRALEEFEDGLVVEIQSTFRELERRFQSLDIQSELILDQTKNVKIAELRFERGELSNRDVVEATQSLLEAQNARINEQVNYEIARLELLRNLGILFIDEQGMWK